MKSPLNQEAKKKGLMSFCLQFLGLFILWINLEIMIPRRWVFWRIWCCLWLKGFYQWKMLSSSGSKSCDTSCVHSNLPIEKGFCWKYFNLEFGRKNHDVVMFSLHWLVVYQSLTHLIYGCWKEHITFLLWLSTLSPTTQRQNMPLLASLRWQTWAT